MVDYRVIEGDGDRFREKLLALYAERQEAHDIALAAVATDGLSSPAYFMAERRVAQITRDIATLLGQQDQNWMP